MTLLRSLLLILVLLFVIFVIAVPIRFVVRLQRKKKRLLKYVGHLSSPKELPIVGSSLRFIWKNSEGKMRVMSGKKRRWRSNILPIHPIAEVMEDTIDFMASHKTPFYAWFGKFLVIVLDKPDDAYTVLTSKSCMEKAPTYKYFNRIGLLTAPGKYRIEIKLLCSVLFQWLCLTFVCSSSHLEADEETTQLSI